jgi:uncharacterized membrane protein
MLTQGFYYFLLICELAIVGLLIVGVYSKVTNIVKQYYLRPDG